MNNFIPYIQLKTTKGNLNFLIDTGANKNYISPRHVNSDRCQRTTPSRVKNINGTHLIDKYVMFNPFPQIPNTSKFIFFVFEFHSFFDGLIGYETLQKLNTKILTSENALEISGIKILMSKKYPNTDIQLHANETKIASVHTSIREGEFFLENDLEIFPEVFVLAGLYQTNNGIAKMVIDNRTASEKQIKLNPVEIEVNNFETMDKITINQEINNFENFPLKFPRKKLTQAELSSKFRLDHLNTEEAKKLLNLIDEFQEIFHFEGESLSFTNAVKHRINTKDDSPVYTKTYRYPFCHKEEVQRQITKMLEQGIIRPSNSPWTSPVWIVPKKMDASGQKKWRLVIDYRKLNEKTISDRYPIPNITDILDKLGRCMYFSTLDLASGFHQIEVHEKDVQKTAFSVDHGHYEFVRMPFGLKKAPSTFQRVMDNVLREHIGNICFVYMDDIIVYSTSLQEHLVNLKKIFNTLNKYDMKIQLDKSEFLRKEVAFLGHVVTQDGVKPNPEKIKVIKEWPLPRNEKELRAFLGILGYYRKFIKDFAKIAKPLTQQLRKGESVKHSREFISAFERCKEILTSSQILIYPDFTKQLVLTTDASKYAIGAVLSQGAIGHDRPIAFASRTLTKSEENYSTIEKELLAIDWACKYFRPYLFGRKFTLYTDHKPLTYAVNLKDAHGKIARWILRLEDYDYDIKHRPGKQNIVADGLSRIHQELHSNEQDESSDAETAHSADTDDSEFIQMTELPLNFFKNQILLKIGTTDSDNYEEIFPGIFRRTVTKINFGVPFFIKMFREYTHPTRKTGILCPENVINTLQITFRNYFSRNKLCKVILTEKLLQDLRSLEEQNAVIEETHLRAHRGIEENHAVIINKFYFPQLKKKIRSYINLCPTCLENKYERNPYKVKFSETPIPKKPLDIVHFDIFI